MTKNAHNYSAIVQQYRADNAKKQTTAAQVVRENHEHWQGFAAAGATLYLAVREICIPYLDLGVNPKSVAREFNRLYGSWKNFRNGSGSMTLPVIPNRSKPMLPSTANAMPVLNDDRLTGGLKFGGQS